MFRKRKQPTPHFKLPPPYQPLTGEHAPLQVKGVFPYVAMMQVAAEDTHKDYAICRGFDIRYNRFIDYEADNDKKPGIPVAKPFCCRRTGVYKIGQIYLAVLPLQTANSSPVSVPWRLGQNPGTASVSPGQPADLDEEISLLKDENDVFINWQFVDTNCGDDVTYVRAMECSKVGERAKAQPQRYDSASGDFEDDTAKDPVYVSDPLCYRLAIGDEEDGEIYKVERPDGAHCSQGTECEEDDEDCVEYIPANPFGLRRRVKVKQSIECGESGPVTVMEYSGEACEWNETDPECVIYACNTSNRTIGCDADEECEVEFTPGECVGRLLPIARPLRAVGTLGTDMCADGSGLLSSIDYPDVCSWETRETVDTCQNPSGYLGCSGKQVDLVWNDADCGWDVVNVQPTVLDEVMKDIKCSTCSSPLAREVYKNVGVQMCENCNETTDEATQVETDMIEVVTTLDKTCTTDEYGAIATCGVSWSKQAVCVLGCETVGTPSEELLSFVTQTVLKDQSWGVSGCTVTNERDYIEVCVMCIGEESSSDQQYTAEDCNAASGSGA